MSLNKTKSEMNETSNEETPPVINEETKKCIYPGDTAIIEVKFMYRPEIVEPGQIFFMREGLTLGIGSFI